MEYQEFLKKKKHSTLDKGIDPIYIPDYLFDFQKQVAEHSIKKGRNAIFLDTGLGKTIIELVIANNYLLKFNKPVLIICPLAVAFQFLKESEKFGIEDIEYSRNGKFTKKIVLCNYEMLHLFNSNDFKAVILDESSILKNYDGARRNEITSFLKKIEYRFLATATPSPNDFIELGTSSEALGMLGYMDMLSKYFKNNEDTISPVNIGTKWLLKGHAKNKFFEWVSSWSVSMRKPSDLGFSDEKFILPKLNIIYNQVENKENMTLNGQTLMFNVIARRMTEVREEQKLTQLQRCERAIQLANQNETSVYWVNFNNEGDLIEKLDKNAVQIKGGMSIDKKEDILMNFADGKIKKLITKPKITAFGLNWQHCNHTVFFPTWSYEQYYQSIRRFWRFGQKNEVFVDLVYSDGQKRVLDSLLAKTDKANELFTKLNANINKDFKDTIIKKSNNISLPTFLKEN